MTRHLGRLCMSLGILSVTLGAALGQWLYQTGYRLVDRGERAA